MLLTAGQLREFEERGAVVFDTALPPSLLDQAEALLDSRCPPPSGDEDTLRPVLSPGTVPENLEPTMVSAISDPVFEGVARLLLRADHVRIGSGYGYNSHRR